jgi:hypothetical protein
MASYNPPTKNADYITYVSLRSFATPGSMQANPTLAAGDVKLYFDGVASTLGAGSSANAITLPTVVGATVVVKLMLDDTEMNFDNITVVFIDQTSPKEWEDLVINLQTGTAGGGASAADIADAVWDEALSGHTTAGSAGKALGDVDTHTDTETGAAAIRAAVGLASANLDTQLSGIQSDTDNIQTRIPAALTADGNIKADALKIEGADPTDTIRDSVLSDATRFAGADVGTVKAAVDTEVAAIKAKTDQLVFTVANQVDANALTGGGGGGASAADIADAVWDEALSGHTTSGTAGKALGDIDTHTDTETGASAIRAALGLASANLDTQLDALPTNAELATALGTADDATLAAIGALSIPTANQNADALLDRAAGVETGHTVRQAMRLMLAALVGKVSGAGGATVTIRDTGDSKNRIVASVDAAGNRSAVTLDQS